MGQWVIIFPKLDVTPLILGLGSTGVVLIIYLVRIPRRPTSNQRPFTFGPQE